MTLAWDLFRSIPVLKVWNEFMYGMVLMNITAGKKVLGLKNELTAPVFLVSKKSRLCNLKNLAVKLKSIF